MCVVPLALTHHKLVIVPVKHVPGHVVWIKTFEGGGGGGRGGDGEREFGEGGGHENGMQR